MSVPYIEQCQCHSHLTIMHHPYVGITDASGTKWKQDLT